MWFLRDGMKISARRYATIAPGKSLLRGKKGPPLTLEHVGTSAIPRSGRPDCTHMCYSSYKEDERWRCGEIVYELVTVCSHFLMWPYT